MKIRTILGILLIIGLVLGSTGIAIAADDADGDGEPDQDRIYWTDENGDGIVDTPPGDGICNDP